MGKIEIRDKRIWIDGQPRLILCGEIHYYRLAPEDWQDRIDKLKAAGCNAVASYVPWLCHEPEEGRFDFTGQTMPQLNLVRFIDLCKENGLYFFVRPGPFIMAEMKNEGLPFWLLDKYPDIVPVTWDGEKVPTKTVDYLAPSFLAACRNWYEAVMGIIAPRLYTNGGNIIAVQLDNEIGMLSWVSGSPDLTDGMLRHFAEWLQQRYTAEELAARYPFRIEDADAFRDGVRSPQECYALMLMRDLGHYMRHRFAAYVSTLRAWAEEFGVRDIPFIINIHGTSGGRGFTYPIGISQLYESYTQVPGCIAGSDIYFGDLNMDTFQDLYIMHTMMDAVQLPDQPLASVEFNCGDGNFGETYGGRYDPSAVDFKLRMSVAQGNRLINYYLFAGGHNYRLPQAVGDGNDRIAFTGERHGFAAPVSPEGALSYTYPRMARANWTMRAADKLADMDEERDNVSFAFIPDYYMTEYRYPKSERMANMIRNLEEYRAYGAWEIMGRAMLLAGYRFGGADIQNQPLDPVRTPVLVLPSARYLDGALQQKLADYLTAGGKLLIYGELPVYDMEGNDCTALVDALGVRPREVIRDSAHLYLSVTADGWAAPRPEVRSGRAQTYEIGRHTAILRVYGSGEPCGFDATVGSGRAIVIGCAYRCDIDLFRQALELLGARARLTHDHEHHGIFMTSTASRDGQRYIHILNLDGYDKWLRVYEDGVPLFEGRELMLQSKDGVMLPFNVVCDDVKIVYSTAEVLAHSPDELVFRLTQPSDVIVLESPRQVVPDDRYTITRDGGRTVIESLQHAKVNDTLTVKLVSRKELSNH